MAGAKKRKPKRAIVRKAIAKPKPLPPMRFTAAVKRRGREEGGRVFLAMDADTGLLVMDSDTERLLGLHE